MTSALYELARQWAKLTAVALFSDPDLHPAVVAMSLVFDRGALHLRAEADDDTIAWIEAIDPTARANAVADQAKVWDAAFGKLLMRAYAMENHNGYHDAVQLEFYNSGFGGETIIQIRAEGARLCFYRLAANDLVAASK